MADLKAKTPCDGLLPLEIGATRLEETDGGVLTSISPLGDLKKLSDALLSAHGMEFPKPNRVTSSNDNARCVWFGRDEALLMGPVPDAALGKLAAVVDQSDAWVVVALSGADAEDVLARVIAVDVRAAHFKRGHTARTQLAHMACSVTRTGVDRFVILVFRSMAATLVHDLRAAMEAVASRS